MRNKVFLVSVQMPEEEGETPFETRLVNEALAEIKVQESIEEAVAAHGLECYVLTEEEASIPAKAAIEQEGKEGLLKSMSVIRKHRDELMKRVATRDTASAINDVLPLLEALLTTERQREHVITLGKHPVSNIVAAYIAELEQDDVPHSDIINLLLTDLTRAELEALGFADFIGDYFADNGEDAHKSPLIPFAEGVCPVCGAAVTYGGKLDYSDTDPASGFYRQFTCGKCGTQGMEGYNQDGAFDGRRYLSRQGKAENAAAPAGRTFFTITIGDYSGDGHNESVTFRASGRKPIDDIRNAYSDIAKLGIDLSGFCCDVGDDVLPDGILQRLQDILGESFELTAAWHWHDEDRDEYHIAPKQMALIIVALLNHVDEELDVRLEGDDDDPPELIGFGPNVGYGLF